MISFTNRPFKFAQTHSLIVFSFSVSCRGSNDTRVLCPVVSLTNYLHLCKPGPGPLFIYQNGTPLSRSQLSSFLQTTLQSAGIPGKFSGHSFRIRAATTAARKTSLRLWGAGLVKLTCYMCVLRWKPSFLLQDDLRSRYELLYPSFGPLFFLGAVGFGHFILWGSGFLGHEPPFLRAMPLPARRSFGLVWGLMAGLPGFASHGSGLHLGAGCEYRKLLDVSGTQPPLCEAVVKCS